MGAPSTGFASAKSAKVKQQQSGFRTARVTSAASSVFILPANYGLRTRGINPSNYFQGIGQGAAAHFKRPVKITEQMTR